MEADIAWIAPLAVSFVLYAGIGLINRYALKMQVKPEVENLMVKLGKDESVLGKGLQPFWPEIL